MTIDYNHAYPDSELAYLTSKESLALTSSPATYSISMFHYIGEKDNFFKIIENQNKVVIKFLADNIPDPTRVYMFYNKRYLCEKIEIELSDGEINPVKTGYFYEIL